MALPKPEPGLVISYAYLWHSEFEQGHEEGRKDRPCAIVLTVNDEAGETIVTVVPITHTLPQRIEEAVEIPLPTKQRLGLDSERSWAVVSETNRFVWPGPDLRPTARHQPNRFDYGVLPPAIFRKIKEGLLAQASAQRLRTVPRTN